jgi:general nucleoside transport system permease protein
VKIRLAQVLGVAIGLIAVLAMTLAVFGLPIWSSMALLAEGAFGDRFGVARTLVKATPLALVALGLSIAWRARMFNIGGEGQFIAGGLCGATFAKFMEGLPPVWLGAGVLSACLTGGALYGGLAGWLYVRRGVDVVISTILLNFVALQLLGWAVAGPLRAKPDGLPLTGPLPQGAMLPRLDPQSDLHVGIICAAAAAVVVYLFLFRTVGGYRMRLVGEAPKAARLAGVAAGRSQIAAMLASGGLCGLAAAIEYLGLAGQLGTSFAQGWGFLGIPVALIGFLHPLVVPLSALYFGALFAGSENLARFTPAGTTIVFVVQGVAVLALVAARSLTRKGRAGIKEPA